MRGARITVALLERKAACPTQVSRFMIMFPRGAAVTVANARRALEGGLNLEWAAQRLLTRAQIGVYQKACGVAWNRYWHSHLKEADAYEAVLDAKLRAFVKAWRLAPKPRRGRASKWVRVTPRLAQRWMDSATPGHHLSPKMVMALAHSMEAGDWKRTRQGITMKEGRLVDGRHRLAAIVLSKKAVDLLVTEESGAGGTRQGHRPLTGRKRRTAKKG